MDSIQQRIDKGLKNSLEDSTEYELRLYLVGDYPSSDKEHACTLLLSMHKQTPLQKQTLCAIIEHCTNEESIYNARELLTLIEMGSSEEEAA